MVSGLVAGSEDQNRGFKRIIGLLIWLVIVPTGLLLAMAIVMLVIGEAQLNLLFGILGITFGGCFITGTVLSLIYLQREANLSKLQTDFVSKVSHELRTPLTSIRMFVEMLQTGGDRDPGETAMCLDVLQRETARLSDRIERLLDWGRMEAGRRVYDLRPETASEIVNATLVAFEASNVGRSLPVSVRIDQRAPRVLADREALVDAVLNLLHNAVKYSSEAPRIEVSAVGEGASLRIAVRDEGVGIPPREHKAIFQKFYRVNDLLSREVEGSGLGLAIVRHVALAHGGRVELKSAPGQGSTFTIVIPAMKDLAAREAA
jgi:two-component system phosphate regulon sensor histidine kinase PhoR